MPARYSSLTLSVVLFPLILTSSPTLAQNGPEPKAVIETIAVTGSRIPQDGFNSPVPLSVVSEEDLKLSGAINTELLLATLPQVIPSNTARTRLGSGTATVDLRGLGDARTLVLVNGRRYMFFDPSQVTDINTIPASLIKRVEIVTGGASAVYGSDAVAGVANFILRHDFEGLELRAQGSSDEDFDGPTRDLSLTLGGNFDSGRGNAVVSVNYLERDQIIQGERGFPFDTSLSEGTGPDGRPALVPSGSANVPFGRFSGIPSGAQLDDPALADLRNALSAAGLGALSSRGFISNADGSARPFDNDMDRFNTAPFSLLQKPQERWAITGMAHYDLNDDLRLTLETSFSRNETLNLLAPTGITGTFQFDVDNPFLTSAMQGVLAALDPLDGNPDDLATLSIGRRLSEVGNRQQQFTRDAWRVNPGFVFSAGDISDSFLQDVEVEGYYLFSQTDGTLRFPNSIQVSAFREGVLRPAAGEPPLLNVFGPNISEEGAQSLRLTPTNLTTSRLEVASLAITSDLLELPAGAVGASLGGEWRKAKARFTPDDVVGSGDITGTTPAEPTAGEVEVREIFGELRVPIVADLPLAQQIAVNGAFRWSDYDLDQVGSVWTYQGGLDWSVSETLALRGQFQRAIRAPNVDELFGGQVDNNPFAFDPCSQPAAADDATIRELCVLTGVPDALVGDPGVQPNPRIDAVSGGNPDLDAESSDTITFGFIYAPKAIPGLRLSADYFDIEVEDAIAPLAGGVDSILNLCFNVIQDINSGVCRAVNRNPVDGAIARPFRVAQLNANIGKLEVAGIDVQATYDRTLPFGLFTSETNMRLQFAGTWTDKNTITPLQDLAAQTNPCVGAFGTTCGEPKPEYKTTTRITFDNGPASVSLRHRFIDSVKLDQVLLPQRQGTPGPGVDDFAAARFSGQHYLDLTITYDHGNGIEWFAGVNNLTDNDPPVSGSIGGAQNVLPSTFDALGREVFVGLVWRGR